MAPGANLHLWGQIFCVWYNHIYRCLFVFRMYTYLAIRDVVSLMALLNPFHKTNYQQL